MAWDLSCPDWEDRLREGRSLIPALPIDMAQGERAVRIFNKLRLADVPGTPSMAEAGGEWFREIVRVMFGAWDPVARDRAIRELLLLVPKKNSKTTNGALMMLTALLINTRPNAPMGLSAPVQDVAELAFDAIHGAIDLDPVLSKKLHVRQHLKTIVHRETGATLEVMTFDPAALTGPKWAAFLLDELHEIAKNAKASKTLRQIRGGMLPYPEAFLAMITTQSDEAPSGVFKAELLKARKIRDGKMVARMLPVLYEFPEKMQRSKAKEWRDVEKWKWVTPNAGLSIEIPRLAEEMATAEASGEAELRGWASQHLNVEIGLALHSDRWAGADYWEDNGTALTLEDLLARSEVVTIGVDGGGLDDLLGLSVLGREIETGHWLHWGRAFVHPIALKRRQEEEARFRDFIEDGDLRLVKSVGDDVAEVGAIIKQVEDSGLLDTIGLDPAGIGAIVQEITGRGIAHERIIGIPQGWKLMGAIQTVERKLAGGTFIHGARPLMAWCVSNAKTVPRDNAVMITKQAAGAGKIDPLMAIFDSAALMVRNPKPRRKKYQMMIL